MNRWTERRLMVAATALGLLVGGAGAAAAKPTTQPAMTPTTRPASEDEAVYMDGEALFVSPTSVPASERLARLRAWAPRAERRLAGADARRAALESEAFDATGRWLADGGQVNQLSGAAFDQLQTLELQQAGVVARANELNRQIQLSRQPKDFEGYQNAMTAWNSAKAELARRQKMLADSQADSPQDAGAIAKLQHSVADETADVAQQWKHVVEARGGDATDALNKQLAQVTIEQQDCDARIRFLRQRLEALRRVGEAIEHDIKISAEDDRIGLWLGQARSAMAEGSGGGN